jgi:hypothetical protein
MIFAFFVVYFIVVNGITQRKTLVCNDGMQCKLEIMHSRESRCAEYFGRK